MLECWHIMLEMIEDNYCWNSWPTYPTIHCKALQLKHNIMIAYKLEAPVRRRETRFPFFFPKLPLMPKTLPLLSISHIEKMLYS